MLYISAIYKLNNKSALSLVVLRIVYIADIYYNKDTVKNTDSPPGGKEYNMKGYLNNVLSNVEINATRTKDTVELKSPVMDETYTKPVYMDKLGTRYIFYRYCFHPLHDYEAKGLLVNYIKG